MELTVRDLAALIDHTLLRAHATESNISMLCEEAVRYGFATVSVNTAWVPFCAKKLKGTKIPVNACIAFPLGAMPAKIKLAEATDAIENGARELDMVINIGALKSGYPQFVEKEIASVVKAAQDVPVKVILETSYLTRDEKILVCQLAARAGAAYVKTSTGFGEHGATAEDVRLMRETVKNTCGVKAAGGIRTLGTLLEMVAAGATRIGTSAGVTIMQDFSAGSNG